MNSAQTEVIKEYTPHIYTISDFFRNEEWFRDHVPIRTRVHRLSPLQEKCLLPNQSFMNYFQVFRPFSRLHKKFPPARYHNGLFQQCIASFFSSSRTYLLISFQRHELQ